ncbi:M23 family metallopeptidase [Treponema sp. OMZ 305]|uniref:peptidoglycan DD-metalloendopeptidase family protein n=1 Tax=Treponema sp. OMZ 305 TaxID=1659192 RepID=UPI0020A3E31D|nr:peptidoglycan DD-metalloendopeptidase family protein [Treponema sp. OMZ 305]UTC57702.1 M23 family metallopeptidase [Treponema sp. OMZ 305]
MKRFFFCILAATMFFAELSALEWPADTQNFVRLFGQRIGENTFEQGLTFEDATTVRAADDGILLITLDKKYGVGAFPSTLGNALVFLHDDGLQTVYGNMDDTTVFRNRITTESAAVIGKTGNSGWGNPNELIFQVSDNQKKVYINPLLLLPSVNDKIAPQIQDIILINEQNTAFQVSGQKNVRQGSYELYADISDTVTQGGHSFSPFRITIFVNGTNIRTIPFETITQKDGESYLGNTAFTDTLLYRRNNELYLGKIILSRGKSDILITARDITGNEKSEQFTIQVD